MARLTLLQMTQDILSEMNSDEVNSIADNSEALQVATVIKNKYFDIVSRDNLPENDQLFQLNPSNDATKPVLMSVPDNISKIQWIKYFDTNVDDGASTTSQDFSHDLNVDISSANTSGNPVAPGYLYVTILPIDQFLEMVNRFNPTDVNVDAFTFSEGGNNFTFYYKNDHQPHFCTIISNHYVIFDMFDSTQDSTLQASKTLCFGRIAPIFLMEDTFIPDLDDNKFPLLYNEAKALAFYNMKQMPHAKAEQETKRQWSAVIKDKSVVNKPSYFDQLPSFGRMPRTGGYGTIWPKLTQSMN